MKKFLGQIAIFISGLFFPEIVLADARMIMVDTSSLAGTPASLAFDFIDGGLPSNTVSLSNFTTDAVIDNFSQAGSVSGTLPTSLVFTDDAFFSEHLQNITLGANIVFTLTDSGNAAVGSSFPDALSLALLDSAGNSLVTTNDPTGANTLFNLSIGQSNGLSIYTGSGFSVTVNAVPEPGAVVLYGAGIALLGWRVKDRKKNVPSIA